MEKEVKYNGCGFASKLQPKTCVICEKIHFSCNMKICIECLNEIVNFFEQKKKSISVNKFESEWTENL